MQFVSRQIPYIISSFTDVLGVSCACEVPRTTNVSSVAKRTIASLAGMIITIIHPTRMIQTDIGPSHNHTENVAVYDSSITARICALRRPVRGARDSSVSTETRLRNGRSGVRILPAKTSFLL